MPISNSWVYEYHKKFALVICSLNYGEESCFDSELVYWHWLIVAVENGIYKFKNMKWESILV